MSDDWKIIDVPPTPEEAERRIKKAEEVVGNLFEHLPGNPPEHKVMEIIDGHKIVAGAVEMVWNDCKLMDHVMGQGYYRKIQSSHPLQLAVLDLAGKLYRQE